MGRGTEIWVDAGDPVTGRSASVPERTGGKRGVVARVRRAAAEKRWWNNEWNTLNVAAVVRRHDRDAGHRRQCRAATAEEAGSVSADDASAGGAQNADRSWPAGDPGPPASD